MNRARLYLLLLNLALIAAWLAKWKQAKTWSDGD